MSKRKVILYIAVSLDGYIADKNGNVDWLEKYSSLDDFDFDGFYSTIDTVIMGKTTYDQILTFGDYPYKGVKSYVYTSKGNCVYKNINFVKGDPNILINDLKQKDGKNIWLIGGANLAHSFIEGNLIDEYQITVLPVILGKGIRLFDEFEKKVELTLENIDKAGESVTLTYSKK